MSAADRPLSNNASECEKREVLRNERQATTYHQLARVGADLDSPGGRFPAQETITGEEAATQYPLLTADHPSSHDPVGLEPALGYDINTLEPTGEAHEIEASLGAANLK